MSGMHKETPAALIASLERLWQLFVIVQPALVYVLFHNNLEAVQMDVGAAPRCLHVGRPSICWIGARKMVRRRRTAAGRIDQSANLFQIGHRLGYF